MSQVCDQHLTWRVAFPASGAAGGQYFSMRITISDHDVPIVGSRTVRVEPVISREVPPAPHVEFCGGGLGCRGTIRPRRQKEGFKLRSFSSGGGDPLGTQLAVPFGNVLAPCDEIPHGTDFVFTRMHLGPIADLPMGIAAPPQHVP